MDATGSTYKPTSSADPIRCYPECPEGGESCGYDLPGWYFWDETWTELHGPFGTIDECKAALDHYCRNVL